MESIANLFGISSKAAFFIQKKRGENLKKRSVIRASWWRGGGGHTPNAGKFKKLPNFQKLKRNLATDREFDAKHMSMPKVESPEKDDRPATKETAGDVCARCGAVAFLFCSGCRRVKYCNETCQKHDWKTHRPACMMTRGKKEAKCPAGASEWASCECDEKPSCWICLESSGRLHRACACRGSGGYTCAYMCLCIQAHCADRLCRFLQLRTRELFSRPSQESARYVRVCLPNMHARLRR